MSKNPPSLVAPRIQAIVDAPPPPKEAVAAGNQRRISDKVRRALQLLADDSKNDMARVASIKALEQISDVAEEKQGKPGAGQPPGLQIIIVQHAAPAPAEPVEVFQAA